MKYGILFLALAVIAGDASAADLKAPFELENTLVLPQGVRNPRFRNLFMSVDQKYGTTGEIEPLGRKLNKLVTWGDIINSPTNRGDTVKQNQIRALMQDAGNRTRGAGFSESESPGSTTGMVNTFADVKVPAFAIGVTDAWTLAVGVPVYDVKVSANTGFVNSDQGQAFIDEACNRNIEECNEAAVKLNDAVNQKLGALGYETIHDMRVQGLGDIRLVNKVLVHNDETNFVAFRGEVTLPTGKAPNADRAVDVPTGDGQWDIGAGMIYERALTRDLRWGSTFMYTAQLPASLDRRLPTSATDSLSDDKERLLRDLGDTFTAGTNLQYMFPALGVLVGAGYNFQYLNKTTYEDGKLDPTGARYRLLEAEYPYQALHSGTLMAGFSTVEWFREKKFVYPFQAMFAYSRPLLGRNVTTNDVFSAELVLFF